MKHLLTKLTFICFLFSLSAAALTNNPKNNNTNSKVGCQIQVAFDYEVENLMVRFNNASMGDYDQLQWDFGDQSHSKEVNPIHTYSKEGMYEFCVTAINSNTQCSQQFCAEVYVFE